MGLGGGQGRGGLELSGEGDVRGLEGAVEAEKAISKQRLHCHQHSVLGATGEIGIWFWTNCLSYAQQMKKKQRPLGWEITELVDMVTSHCILCCVLETLTCM